MSERCLLVFYRKCLLLKLKCGRRRWETSRPVCSIHPSLPWMWTTEETRRPPVMFLFLLCLSNMPLMLLLWCCMFPLCLLLPFLSISSSPLAAAWSAVFILHPVSHYNISVTVICISNKNTTSILSQSIFVSSIVAPNIPEDVEQTSIELTFNVIYNSDFILL